MESGLHGQSSNLLTVSGDYHILWLALTHYAAHDQRFLTPEEELQFYGFSEENAHKMLLEAEFVEDEDDAYEMALTHVLARQEMKRFGWFGKLP